MAKIIEACTQTLEEPESKDAANIDENIEIADEQSELDGERVYTTEYPTQDLVLHSEVQEMIATRIKRWTSYSKDLVLSVLMEEKLIEVLRVAYDAAKEGGKTPLFNPVREVIVDIIHGEWWTCC